MPARWYPVTEPHLDGDDRAAVLDAFDSGWISSQGRWLQEFEKAFADFAGTRYAYACCNGTAGLHLALLALGLKPGDEVIVPTFTYIATANAVHYCGATPVLVDAEPDTWNLDPRRLAAAVGPRTVGIIPVHLYGHPCDMEPIQAIARQHGLWILEDAAEAHGAEYLGRRAGTLGHAAVFSLYGNKIITTGEGGVITTDDETLGRRIQLLRGQGMDPERRYWFPVVGFNYRMTNLAAALGCSQLRKVDALIAAHRAVAAWYRAELAGCAEIVLPVERPGTRPVAWLSSARLPAAENRPAVRDEWMRRLAADGIETRPFFYPMHVLPPYSRPGFFPVADRISTSGINLPSSPKLEASDIRFIAARVRHHAVQLTADSAREPEAAPGPVFEAVPNLLEVVR